jgi:hypothetical protein
MTIGYYQYIIKLHINSLSPLFCDLKNRFEFLQRINKEKISMIINDNEIFFFDVKEISKEKDW